VRAAASATPADSKRPRASVVAPGGTERSLRALEAARAAARAWSIARRIEPSSATSVLAKPQVPDSCTRTPTPVCSVDWAVSTRPRSTETARERFWW
jgi:hypothetical protein